MPFRCGVVYLVETSPCHFFRFGGGGDSPATNRMGAMARLPMASGLIKKITTKSFIVNSTIIFTYNPGEPKLQMAVTAMSLSRQ